jgi:dihydrofolate reductase
LEIRSDVDSRALRSSRQQRRGQEGRAEREKETNMSATVLYMSMSLDGFIAGPNERVDNGLGDGGHRLHEWMMPDGGAGLDDVRSAGGVNGGMVDEFMATGAVLAGRGTVEPAGAWGGDHHDGVPIFVLTRHASEDLERWPLVTCVDDVTTAMSRAKRAAGDRDVLVHGAGTAQLALAAGVLDELQIHVVPVLFGQGRRLFESLPAEQIELERTRILEGEGGVTHIRYRVRR